MKTRRSSRRPGPAEPAGIGSLPDECLVEVFRSLDVEDTLSNAGVSSRWRRVAQDPALWQRTRFSSIDTDRLLSHEGHEGHFRLLSQPRVDHTGSWAKCERKLGRVRLLCRSVDLDYVEAGEGVSYRLLRSISCLQQLHHPTVVPLLLVNVDVPRNQLQLFYGDVGTPLEVLLKAGRVAMEDARCVLRQVLQALAHCHAQGITHRNLKPKYIMLEEAGGAAAPHGRAGGALPGERWNVRISDFNSVRWLLGPSSAAGGGGTTTTGGGGGALYGAAHVLGASSPTVVTQPYRAPEILLGSTHYTTAIDVWAAGCVFAEAASGQMLFVGDSDIGQLFKIFEVLGTPGAAKATPWRGVEALPHYNELFPNMPPRDWARFPALAPLLAQPDAADLLSRMLALDPTERISAAGALEHPFFTAQPPARPETPEPLHGSGSPSGLKTPSRPRAPATAATERSLPSGGGGLFGTPSQPLLSGDGGVVWRAWRAREEEQATALRLEEGAAIWRRHGDAADEARSEAVAWLLGAACEFCRSDRTVHLAVTVLDRYLAVAPRAQLYDEGAAGAVSAAPSGALDERRLRVSAAAALLLACKFQEVETHTVEQLTHYCRDEHSTAQLLEAELSLCVALHFDFAHPTAVDCLFCALARLSWPDLFSVHRGLSRQVAMLAQYLCELSLLIAECAPLRPSLVASAALCLAAACLRTGRWTDGSPGAASEAVAYWTPFMAQATGYSAARLSRPLELLRAQHAIAHRELGHLSRQALQEYGASLDAHYEDAEAEPRRFAPLARKFIASRFLGALHVPPFSPHAGGALSASLLVHDESIEDGAEQW
mmetsp:Transcript_46604/g.151269  ORF Transcript_46604/g.151269 Transcript_46604/m.151269 type:complete len:827 (-) Transcript_46604:39-2519(-)